jgi:hypothetical protein
MHVQMHSGRQNGGEPQTTTEGGAMRNEFSNGVRADLLEGAQWVKSSHSGYQGNCVEVAKLPTGEIAMRNSRFPSGPALVYTRDEINAFVAGAKDGEFDAYAS